MQLGHLFRNGNHRSFVLEQLLHRLAPGVWPKILSHSLESIAVVKAVQDIRSVGPTSDAVLAPLALGSPGNVFILHQIAVIVPRLQQVVHPPRRFADAFASRVPSLVPLRSFAEESNVRVLTRAESIDAVLQQPFLHRPLHFVVSHHLALLGPSGAPRP